MRHRRCGRSLIDTDLDEGTNVKEPGPSGPAPFACHEGGDVTDPHPEHVPTTWRPSGAAIRWVLTTLVGAVAMFLARPIAGDWGFFVQASRRLFDGDGLSVYALMPNIQSGPVSLAAFAVLDGIGVGDLVSRSIVFALPALAACWSVERIAADVPSRRPLTQLVGSAILVVCWISLRSSGHLDDAIVIALTGVALVLILEDRHVGAALVVGLCLAIKPWAIFLVPVTARQGDDRTQRLALPALSLFVGALAWAPFLIAESGTLDGFRPTVQLAPDSVLRLLGLTNADLGSTLRIAQLIAALVAVWALVRRRAYGGALLAGFALRLLLDPGTWPYYTVGLVFAALVWDVRESPWRLPFGSLATVIMLAPQWVIGDSDLRAVLRLACCIVAVIIAFASSSSRRMRRAALSTDTGDSRVSA